jgi:N-acetylglutamate synthase-like GNAT family acetyltransferase
MQSETDAPEYTVRRFSSADVRGYLDLLDAVWGVAKSTDWFRWRFTDNPYVSETPSVVATHDGEVVGVESCLALRLHVGSRESLVFQPVDWAVHPDHRKRGLCTRMTERLVDELAESPAALYFNFPSAELLPCLRKFGWRFTAAPRTWCRIQNPGALTARAAGTESSLSATLRASLGRLAAPVAEGYLRYRDRTAGPDTHETVERAATIPVDEFVALYERTVPEGVHVVRDSAFYRWRFENPRWEPTTYLARHNGRLLAACIACAETTGAGYDRTSVLDVLPRDGSASDEVLEGLLAAVVADATEADILRVNAAGFPTQVLRAVGFWPTDAAPLSLVSTSTPMAVRPLSLDGARPWRVHGVELTDEDAWDLTLAAQDVG